MPARAPTPPEEVIELRAVTHRFGAWVAVDGLSLSVPAGTGASGSAVVAGSAVCRP